MHRRLDFVLNLLPEAAIRCLARLAGRIIYRVRVYGAEHVPKEGGALLVANHVSWIDGILLLIASSRPIRMVAYADYMHVFGVRQLARLFQVIPIKGTAGPKEVLRSLKTAREAAVNGELVCIFAEGRITRTGQLQAFQRGVLRIVEGTDVPVIPTYLDGLWGSIFSYRGGKLLWKRPRPTGSARRDWRFPVSIFFGPPLQSPKSVTEVHRAVQELGVEAMERRKKRELVLPRRFLRRCRSSLRRLKIADSTGQELTGGRLLTATLALKRVLQRSLAPDERTVGILLPPSAGGVLANAGISLMRRVAVNLNYTLTNEGVNFCIGQAGIRHVITSRRFLEQRPFDLNAEVIYLEDLKERVTAADRAVAALQAYLGPVVLLERLHGLTGIDPDDLLTIIFTSGATGMPKGVQLSHHNVLSNIDGIAQLFRIERTDVLLGILPFFHSFGYTGTLWFALALEPAAVYHFNPLDARRIGNLCERYGVTIAMATPTFLRSYLKRCRPEQLETLDLVIVGAEKLPRDLAQAFEEKFGVLPTEGYGTTELSPVAAVNVPARRSAGDGQGAFKAGTVGRSFPGVAAKVVDPETGDELGTDREGLLLIKGPNVMLGYLNQPDKTEEVLQDGWYNTGDFARIDEDGFIRITGRQTRFSKIGGEMVPHVQIEEAIARIVELHLSQAEKQAEDDGQHEVRLAVTSVPDEKRGERLIVLHKPLPVSVDQVLKELSETDLPNLWLPDRDSFVEVDHIPVLGSGKLDLKAVTQLAEEKWASRAEVQ